MNPKLHAHLVLAASATLLLAPSLHAGEVVAAKKIAEPKIEKKADPLLRFAEGKVVFNVEGRLRFEARSNHRDFDNASNDDNDNAWLLTRFRLGVTIKPHPWLKLVAQTQDVREIDSDRPNTPGVRGTEGGDEFDLRLAYFEIGHGKEFPLSLTVGRQRLHYGSRRLIADSNWGNFGRTFDALKLRWQEKSWWVEAFAARPVQIREDVFNDSDSADNFFGLYASTDALGFQTTDFYVLHRDKGDEQPDLNPTNTFDPNGAASGPAQRITTIGTRWQSKEDALGGWDYYLEAAVQFGDVWQTNRASKKSEHRAFAAGVAGGYTFQKLAWEPRLGLGYDYASGDRDPDDARSQSFQNLFPSNHEPYGLIDSFAWRNLHDAHLDASAQLTKTLALEVEYHAFWLAQTSDAWFRSNGITPHRTTDPAGRDVRRIGASDFVGQEIDVTLNWEPRPWLKVQAGYAHFFAGDYLAETGPSDDADFGWLQIGVAF